MTTDWTTQPSQPSQPSATAAPSRSRTILTRVAIGLALLVLLIVALALFFPWNMLREPLNRFVSEKTGRKFEITRRLDVHPGLFTATIDLDGIEFANPEWARKPYLLKAERADFDIRLWPLLTGKVVLPRIALVAPEVGLQMEPDGRRTWALGKDTSDKGTTPTIGQIKLDKGAIDFLAPQYGIDLQAKVDFDTQKGKLPLSYSVSGSFQKRAFKAEGSTGNVLQLEDTGRPPFPLVIDASAGQTRVKADGTVAQLDGPDGPDGIDAKFQVQGQSLGDLYRLFGIALPETSPYNLNGRMHKNGKVYKLDDIAGKLGLSDLEGTLNFDGTEKTPRLFGDIRSKVLDMDDLGPLIGLPPTKRSADAIEGVKAPPTIAEVKKGSKVLPTATLDFERLRAVNADVKYAAQKISNVRQLPLDSGKVHVKLEGSKLRLDPLELGVAGGKIAGPISIDATKKPADIRAALDVRDLQINRMVPKIDSMKSSFGKLGGRINLSGPGISVAGWLGGASGDVSVITGRGEFSNLLLEFAGLDAGEAIKFFVEGDKQVKLRCAAIAFDVNKGVMASRSIVLDTTDTVFYATGKVNLAKESLDLKIEQEPKDMSILSLRSPITVGGSFASPSIGVSPGPLAARGLAVAALAAINPLLALLPTIETGPGDDSDCKEVLADAKRPSSGAAGRGAAKAKAARTKSGASK